MTDERMNVTALPEEVHTLVEFRQKDLPGFAMVKSALGKFESRTIFSWHLSVLIDCEELVANRLPSPNEQNVLYQFEDRLDSLIKTNGNALFLARVTHDGHREIIWRVRDPEIANAALREILLSKGYQREFEFRIEEDPTWQKALWYLNNVPSR